MTCKRVSESSDYSLKLFYIGRLPYKSIVVIGKKCYSSTKLTTVI